MELRDIHKPVAAGDEVLVRVHAASVHPDVSHAVRGVPYVLRIMGSGLLKPKNKIPGLDMAGRAEAVGAKVTRFRPGDEVFGETISAHRWHNAGAYAEYVAVPEEVLARKPASLTFEQAAAVPTSASIALRSLRDQGRIRPGQKVLINGAGGGVGTFAVQLAKAFGAEVTGVDSTKKLDMLRSIGADKVIDYTQQDFTQSGERYDLMLDIAANHSFSDCRRALTPAGTYVIVGDAAGSGRWIGVLGRALKALVLSQFVGQGMGAFVSVEKKEAMGVLRELIEAGKVTPVIDRTYPLSEVPQAIRYVEQGHVQGKVIITV
ncbi:MAG: NAD(P)-dependent alcohol dehydrogenase [Actinobacteria bacterium]|nr:NAD(P)-dependent alcohol dehydrogenase [Actinomycetota bacterium]